MGGTVRGRWILLIGWAEASVDASSVASLSVTLAEPQYARDSPEPWPRKAGSQRADPSDVWTWNAGSCTPYNLIPSSLAHALRGQGPRKASLCPGNAEV